MTAEVDVLQWRQNLNLEEVEIELGDNDVDSKRKPLKERKQKLV